MEILNIADINVAEYVEYDTPEQTPVWAWIEEIATYGHLKNHDADNFGIWEFVVNTSCITDEDSDVSIEDAPKEIQGAVREAIDNGAAYILFHQGT